MAISVSGGGMLAVPSMRAVGFAALVAVAASTPIGARADADEPWKAFDSRRAFEQLSKQVGFGPRVPGSVAHGRFLDWMEAHFRALGLKTRRQTFSAGLPLLRGHGSQGTNLFADLASTATRRIALTAHWDTRPVADRDPNPANRAKPIPGANDGASGVAVLMELARLLRDRPPDVGVVFVCLDMEDAGRYSRAGEWCVGSREAARRWPREWRIDWGINLDMIGDRDLLIKTDVESVERAPAINEKVWRIAEKRYPLHFSRQRWPAIIDDHVSFLNAGIPFIDIIDYDYPSWHTLSDDVAHCSPRSLQIVGEVVAEVVYAERAK